MFLCGAPQERSPSLAAPELHPRVHCCCRLPPLEGGFLLKWEHRHVAQHQTAVKFRRRVSGATTISPFSRTNPTNHFIHLGLLRFQNWLLLHVSYTLVYLRAQVLFSRVRFLPRMPLVDQRSGSGTPPVCSQWGPNSNFNNFPCAQGTDLAPVAHE